MAAFQQTNWVHVQRRDLAEPGMIHSSYSDSWFGYPKDNQTCVESLELVKDQPASDRYNQILVGLSDGSFGDLIQLREGTGVVSHSEPGTSGCYLAFEFTSAGHLAVRLRQEQAASWNQEAAVEAWYVALDGRPVFTVSTTFTQPSKGNYTGITKETHSFDVETGLVVQEGIRMEWEDGSLFGESLQVYETEFLSELPADVAAQSEQFFAELKAYADGIAARPTAVPAQEAETSVSLNELPYTEEHPLTDGQTILQILRALKQHQIARLAQPGWYVYGPNTPDTDDWMSNRYLLTHTLDANGACEYMSYYVKDGVILPQEIVLADGRWGLIGVVNGGQVSMGETGRINWSNGPMTDTCLVPNTETVSFIQNETDYFHDLVDGKLQGTYEAWAQKTDGRDLFVLYYDIQGDGLGTVMDPDTRKLETVDFTRQWVYFDLDWGAALLEAGEQIFTLQNGKTIGSAPTPDKTINDGYTYYKELPAGLAQAYAETVARLVDYLQK